MGNFKGCWLVAGREFNKKYIMDELLKKFGFLCSQVWCCGEISTGVTAIGFTNFIGLCLGFLLYLGTITEFSISLIVVIFLFILGLFSSCLLMYGATKGKPHLLLAWMTLTGLGLLSLLVYTSIYWSDLAQYKAITIGALIFSFYCIYVVAILFQSLRITPKEKNILCEEGEGTPRANGLLSDKEETVLVLLEQDTPVTKEEHKLPKPEEVIGVPILKNNPFLSDIFQVSKNHKSDAFQKSDVQVSADFSPFKGSFDGNSADQSDTSTKLNVFLPSVGEAEESDFDFSFNDPAFDSSLCAKSHNVD